MELQVHENRRSNRQDEVGSGTVRSRRDEKPLQCNCSRGRAHRRLTPKNIPSVTGSCTNGINNMGSMLTPRLLVHLALLVRDTLHRELVPVLCTLSSSP